MHRVTPAVLPPVCYSGPYYSRRGASLSNSLVQFTMTFNCRGTDPASRCVMRKRFPVGLFGLLGLAATVIVSAQGRPGMPPLADRIAHTDPARYRSSPAVHGPKTSPHSSMMCEPASASP